MPDQSPPLWLRILRFPATLMVLGFVLFVACYVLTQVAASVPLVRHSPLQPLVALAGSVLGIWLYTLFQRRVEGQASADYAVSHAGLEAALGAATGAALFSATVLGVWALGDLRFAGPGDPFAALWAVLAMAIFSGIYEELIFRGLLFRHLETMLGSWAALLLTSALFGAVHMANPHATWFAAFAIAAEAGVLLGAAYMYTRRLWLASGLHAAWNFTQGWVFSVPVSGGKVAGGLVLTTRSGPELITGGAFGLEASVVALAVAGGAGLVLLAMALRRDGAQPPMWRRPAAVG
ncbi:MAG: CPBP family intramembrane metalloprotease [Proteobacteria bacterium]|nr:CPBP family intramembrane metalloprotease [Pseudomonadota bacterium]